jgi:hypothetical protein
MAFRARSAGMSEQEFELYLKLLAKCLHLTSGQRAQIADELRDHLESRLEELARAGVPREKAVVQALDEFGDAAVLASDFTTIARLKRRRFLMRLSLGSVGALTAALLIAYAFWPENRAVRGPEQIVAQDKPKAEQHKAGNVTAGKRLDGTRGGALAEPHRPPAVLKAATVEHPSSSDLVRRSKPEERIHEALNQPVDFSIEPQALKDALDFIAARYQIPILIDRKALDDSNIDMSAEVHLNAPGILLKDALELMFDQMPQRLGYDVVHEVLMISTVDKINEHTETIVYDCRDLINLPALETPAVTDHRQADASGQAMFQFGGGGVGAAPAAKANPAEKPKDRFAARAPFIRMVISATGTNLWEEEEGGASISELGGLLIVRQTPRVHERIKELLASIRQMKKEGAFAALGDQYDAEAKHRAAEQSTLAERVSLLEKKVDWLRKGSEPAKPQIDVDRVRRERLAKPEASTAPAK